MPSLAVNKNVTGSVLSATFEEIKKEEPSEKELYRRLKTTEEQSDDLIRESIEFLEILEIIEYNGEYYITKKDEELQRSFIDALGESETVFSRIYNKLIEEGKYQLTEAEFDAFLRGQLSEVFDSKKSTANKSDYWRGVMDYMGLIRLSNQSSFCISYPEEFVLDILKESSSRNLREAVRDLNSVVPCLTSTEKLVRGMQDTLLILEQKGEIELTREEDYGSGFSFQLQNGKNVSYNVINLQ
jgi:hypothetical protein